MNKIKLFRMNAKMKQADLARMVGVSQAALSSWENGKYEPDSSSFRRLADIFGCTVDELIDTTPGHYSLTIDSSGRISSVFPPLSPEPIPENAWLLDAYDSAPAHIRRIVDVALEPYKDTNENE